MKNTYKILLLLILLTVLGKLQAQTPTRIEEDYNVSLTPAGWTNSLNTASLISRVTTVQSFGRSGTVAAIRANNYNVVAGSVARLETPLFSVPTILEDTLRFDVAHAAYTGGEQDSLIVLAFDGVSYNRIAAWGSSPTIDLAGITTAVAQAAAFVPTSSQWVTKKLALPVGTTGIQFEFYSDEGNQLYIDRVIVDSFDVSPMVYNSSTTTQSVVSNIFNGAVNQQIIGITVNVSGNNSPIDVTNFDFNTGATTNALASIDNAKVFYTGSTNAFSTTGFFGQIASPNGAFSITGTQTLGNGNNYFWLVYDIKPAVTSGDTIDADCASITVGGFPQTPTITSPSGQRIIDVATAITVTASAGAPYNTYNTLKAAFDNINAGFHQGNIDMRINSSLTETVSSRLDSSGAASGASYTSILIRPADTVTVLKTITCATGAIAVIELNGADNVTIDGRAGGAGSTSLLQIVSTSTTAGTVNLRLTNGAQNNTVTYLSSQCAMNATTNTITHLAFTAGSVAVGNANNTFSNNFFNQGSRGVTLDGNASALSSNNTFYRNTIQNFKTFGFQLSSGIQSVNIDSNVITHLDTYSSTETTGMYGIDLNFLVDNSTINITRNTISNLSTSANSSTVALRAIRIIPQTATVNAAINIYNNAIALTRTNAGITGNQVFRGIDFQGTQPAVVRLIHNSIRIGGANTVASAGAINSVGIFKTNSNAGSTFISLNNISVNTRTSGSGFNAASWVSSLAGTIQADYNVYSTNPGNYTALWFNGANSTIYNTTTTYRGGALVTPNEQHSHINAVTFTANNDLSLSGVSVNDYVIFGTPLNGLVTVDNTGTTRIDPTYRGAYQAAPFTNRVDAFVKEVYTLGKLPIPYAIPHGIRANIFNSGIDTLFNQQVDVQVTGANSFTDVQFIDTIIPGSSKIVTFSDYNYSNIGNCVVTVTVPSDSTNTNNSKSFNQTITNDVYAYAEPTLPSIGGVGFNGIGGDFIAKFPYVGSNNINQVGVTFNTGGQPYQIVIFDMLNDTPGTLLWNSNTLTSVVGVNTVPVIPAVGVSGSFFVGVRQTGLVNVGFGYQAEDPIRNKVFYYKATTVNSWQDFATTNSAFRFMVEPRLQVADDIGAESVVLPCASVILGSAPFRPEVKVLNYGLNTQDSIVVGCQITGPVSYNSTDTFGGLGIPSGQSTKVILGGFYNPTIVGSYTMKVWTRLLATSDLSTGNDTLTYTFDVTDVNTFTDAGNHLTLNGTNQSVSVNGEGSLNISGTMLTLEAWVNRGANTNNRYIISKELDANVSQYCLYVNSSGNVVFKLYTINGVDSTTSSASIPLTEYAHVAATYDGMLGSARIYINGVLTANGSIFGSIIGNSGAVSIGKGFIGGTTHFSGNLDEVKIWDTVRTEDQIRSNIHVRMANFAHANLKGYWRMDEASGLVISDASGNCNAGILQNTPVFATSTIPLGAPMVFNQAVSVSGFVDFPGSNVSADIYNQSGANDIYIHKFSGLPIGTSPITIPGGVTAVNPNNYIIYQYGTGTMDSAQLNFYTNGITLAANPGDFFLFSRGVGSNGGWVVSSVANAADPNTGIVSFMTNSSQLIKQFAVGANNNSLPVKLLYFTAKGNNTDVNLRWATANESDNAGFTIERSTDGKNFINIGFVKGKGKSAELSTYTSLDKDAFIHTASSKLYYRLVQTDFNGKKEISNTVIVLYGRSTQGASIVYPNPFSSEVSIDIDAKTEGAANIMLMDITGKLLYERTGTVKAGLNTLQTNGLDALPKGVYLLQWTINGEVTTQKMVKQ